MRLIICALHPLSMVWQHNTCALSCGRPRPPMHRDFNALRRKFLRRGQSSLCMLVESAFEVGCQQFTFAKTRFRRMSCDVSHSPIDSTEEFSQHLLFYEVIITLTETSAFALSCVTQRGMQYHFLHVLDLHRKFWGDSYQDR